MQHPEGRHQLHDIIASGLVEKICIMDTSAFIHHPPCVEVLSSKGNLVVAPWATVEQLDNLKTRQDLKGASAREAVRQLKGYRQQSLKEGKLLRDGVKTKSGGWIAVDYFSDTDKKAFADLPVGFDPAATPDNQIIFTALQWKKKHPQIPVVVISKDNTLLLRADILGICAEDYEHDTVLNSISELYTGIKEISIDNNNADFINDLYAVGRHKADARAVFKSVGDIELYPNQCCKFIDANGIVVALALYKHEKKVFRYVERNFKSKSAKGIVPMNDEQAFARALLTDPDIYFVTLVGQGGTGKTLISLWAGASQLDDLYQSMLVFRPIVEMGGRSLGFYKGTLEEKFEPWTEAIMDNLDLIEMSLPAKISRELRKQKLKMSPLIHVRGRSIHDKFILVDDAQNLTPHEAKTIATRPAGISKLVFSGDPGQIDEPYLSPISNGLVYTVQRMKGAEVFGHILLTETVRSLLARITAERL